MLARAFLLDLLHNLAEATMAGTQLLRTVPVPIVTIQASVLLLLAHPGTRRVLYYSPEADKEKFELMLAEERELYCIQYALSVSLSAHCLLVYSPFTLTAQLCCRTQCKLGVATSKGWSECIPCGQTQGGSCLGRWRGRCS